MGVAISSDDPPPSTYREVLLSLSVSSAATYAVCGASGPGRHHVVRIVHHLSRLSSIFPEEFHSWAGERTSAPSVFIFHVVWGAGPASHLHMDVEFSGTMAGSIWLWHLSRVTPITSARFSFCALQSVWLICLSVCMSTASVLTPESCSLSRSGEWSFLYFCSSRLFWICGGSFDILYGFYFLAIYF